MTGPNKTITISDIHISNGAVYSWFRDDYPKWLTEMLTQTASDTAVAELVLIGDLFDLWLYPIDVVPFSVERILDANPTVTDALRKCVQDIPDVYYLNGNHDMTVVASDLAPLSSGEKSVKLITPEWYREKYQGRRHIEHGNAVDMFNAPDNSGDTIGGYPLGFFITRLVATAKDQPAAWKALERPLTEQAAVFKARRPEATEIESIGSAFVKVIIDALMIYADVKDSTSIRFREKELDNKYTVGDIKEHYGSLLSTWFHKSPEHFLDSMLVCVHADGLDWYAKKLLKGNASPKVVVMGHTHHAESEGAYDNDGCWCVSLSLGHADERPYYVEIIGDNAELIPWETS